MFAVRRYRINLKTYTTHSMSYITGETASMRQQLQTKQRISADIKFCSHVRSFVRSLELRHRIPLSYYMIIDAKCGTRFPQKMQSKILQEEDWQRSALASREADLFKAQFAATRKQMYRKPSYLECLRFQTQLIYINAISYNSLHKIYCRRRGSAAICCAGIFSYKGRLGQEYAPINRCRRLFNRA